MNKSLGKLSCRFRTFVGIQIGGRWRIKKSALDHDILRQDKQGQATVLVVDDDSGLQDLFRTFLKQIGFRREWWSRCKTVRSAVKLEDLAIGKEFHENTSSDS